MKGINKYGTAFNFLIIVALAVYIFIGKTSIKAGYIEVNKVYSEFKLTKELEKKFKAVTDSRKYFLDSLEITLRSLSTQKEKEAEFNRIRNEYLMKKQQFEEDNQAMTTQYSEQIMNQMNQYLMDYGKQNNYDFVFGANGTGALMYANENVYDITKEVANYINQRFDGKAN